MDVVFMSELIDGQRVADGRLPQHIPDVSHFHEKTQLPATPLTVGTNLSNPINVIDGRFYGTLCCHSASPTDKLKQRDMQNLRSVAQLVARKMDRSPLQLMSLALQTKT